ncbi:MAG: hypothetical protein RL497_1983 [Pseudomonadota bacterium]|jgi:hypothetical protein
MEERREHQRIPLRVSIKIAHPECGEKIVTTRNFSEGGLFIIIEPTQLPSIGTLVKGQIQGLDDAPLVDMKIVRLEHDGVGLQYMDGEAG